MSNKLIKTGYLFSVATGNVDPTYKESREAAKFIGNLEGFKAVHPAPDGRGTLWFFDSLNNAKRGRNRMRSEGIECGRNIGRFKWGKDGILEFDSET